MNQGVYPGRKLLAILGVIVIAMFGFGYALVPIYNVMCKQFGINGKTGGAVSYDPAVGYVDKDRTVTVQFLATNNEGLHWLFHPNVQKLKFHPGEQQRLQYFARNEDDHTMIVQAIPSVTPGIAAQYLKKTECFCFTQQTLKSHQQMNMPIVFHIDPSLPKSITTITLSYTLFDVTERVKKRS